jgi:hypothetical protein
MKRLGIAIVVMEGEKTEEDAKDTFMEITSNINPTRTHPDSSIGRSHHTTHFRP